jgi:multicomponent Na+:H+ antiporter subunit E
MRVGRIARGTQPVAVRLPGMALLLAVWLALWGELTAANVAGGIVVVGLVSLAFPARVHDRRHRVRPVGVVRLVAFTLAALARSSVTVARTVLRPTAARLRAGIVRVPLSQDSPLVATIMTQLIGITPGTMVVGVDADGPGIVLLVHALGLGDVDAFRDDIRSLERRVLAAVSPYGSHVHGTGPADGRRPS